MARSLIIFNLGRDALRFFLKADKALIPFSHFWLIGKINVLYHALADAREYRGWDFPELSHGTYDLSFSVLFCFVYRLIGLVMEVE